MKTVKKVDVSKLFCDICNNVNKKGLGRCFWGSVLLCIPYILLKPSEGVATSLLELIWALFAIQATAYSIFFAVCTDKTIIETKSNEGKSPFEEIHADFAFGILSTCFLSIILPIMNVLDMCQCLTDSLTFFTAVFAVMWTCHVFLHLYAIRTAFKHRTE